MKKLIISALLFGNFAVNAQETPRLEFFCELNVMLDPAVVVGDTPRGTRRIIPITGGIVTGPTIKGEILKGGADWQIVRKDGVAELEAHYQFKTDDGTVIYIKNIGVRVATPEVGGRYPKATRSTLASIISEQLRDLRHPRESMRGSTTPYLSAPVKEA